MISASHASHDNNNLLYVCIIVNNNVFHGTNKSVCDFLSTNSRGMGLKQFKNTYIEMQ